MVVEPCSTPPPYLDTDTVETIRPPYSPLSLSHNELLLVDKGFLLTKQLRSAVLMYLGLLFLRRMSVFYDSTPHFAALEISLPPHSRPKARQKHKHNVFPIGEAIT
jgi:hypothetical protein